MRRALPFSALPLLVPLWMACVRGPERVTPGRDLENPAGAVSQKLEGLTPRPGPLLSDEQFFAKLDLSQPELAGVAAAVGARDLGAAKRAFLAHLRARTTPRWWFDHRDRPQTKPMVGGSRGWDYYHSQFTVDFTGWKRIELPLAAFITARSPIGWHHINNLQLSASYGNRSPDPRAQIILDDIRLEGDETFVVADFESGVWPHLLATHRHKVGQRAALWASLAELERIGSSAIPRDWRKHNVLSMWVWSAAATGDVVSIIAESDVPERRRADDYLEHVYKGHSLGDDIDWTTNPRRPTDPAYSREWQYDLNRLSMWQELGRAYWQTGDEKYAREWIAQMRDWIEDNPWPRLSTGNDTFSWRTIEAGRRTADSWQDTLQYFLASPSLTADDLVMFMKSWIDHAHHLMRITVEHPGHAGNWVTMECNGLAHLGTMLPEAKDSDLWLQTAVDRMLLELDRQVYPDGAQMELTSSYHQVALRNFVAIVKIARHNGRDLPPAYLAKLERMYDYALKAMTPERRLPPLNDADYTDVREQLAEGAGLFGRDDFRWAATYGSEGTRPDYTSVALPYAGQYVMRSGWSRDDLYALFESGPFGTGHQHEDMLSLFLWARGRTVLTEGGTYSYDSSKWRRHVLGSWSHNTIIVDGQEQARRSLPDTYRTDKPYANLWVTNPVFDAADGLYDGGYGDDHAVAVAHERTVVFIKPDYWLVLDRLHGTGTHRYDILWHLDNDAARQDDVTLAGWGHAPGRPNLLVTPAPIPGLQLEIVRGRERPPLGWGQVDDGRPKSCLDYRLQADGSVTLAWALTPHDGAPPAIKVDVATERGGTRVTVSGRRGTDVIFVAPRGETRTVDLAGKKLTGTVTVLRKPKGGPPVAASGQ